MNLTYEIINDGKGYMIKNNGVNWIKQDTYHPYPADTTEQAAQNHINVFLAEQQAQQDEVSEIEQLRAKTIELEHTLDSILTEVLPALLEQ